MLGGESGVGRGDDDDPDGERDAGVRREVGLRQRPPGGPHVQLPPSSRETDKPYSRFWWLYYADPVGGADSHRPLYLWLQVHRCPESRIQGTLYDLKGGPGSSGTGFGNFEEFGPLDGKLNPRNTTWVGDWGHLAGPFPGLGFAAAKGGPALRGQPRGHRLQLRHQRRRLHPHRPRHQQRPPHARPTLVQPSFKLPHFLISEEGPIPVVRFGDHPAYQKRPFYILSESYGGKMTAHFASVLYPVPPISPSLRLGHSQLHPGRR